MVTDAKAKIESLAGRHGKRSTDSHVIKRAAVALGVTSLLLGPSISASASSGRVVRHAYTTSAVARGPLASWLGFDCTGGCLVASAGPREHRVRIEMRDASGLAVYGMILGGGYNGYAFCGSIVLDVYQGDRFGVEAPTAVDPFTPCAQPTTGTIVASFSG